ncbi:MAG: hypothetical protein ACTSQG_11240 [Promethearchaeota archaeon]
MIKKVSIILIFLFFLINSFLFSYSKEISGNNIIWSPVSDTIFLFSKFTKGSGKSIWKLYDLDKGRSQTLIWHESLIPKFSSDGKFVIFAVKNKFLIYNIKDGTSKEFNSAVDTIESFDVSLSNNKIVYSDGDKIYVLNIFQKDNFFVVNGSSPFFINSDKTIIYFDEDLKVNLIDESLSSKSLLTNVVSKLIPFKKENKFLFSINNYIKLYDLDKGKIFVLIKEKNGIDNFNISYDGEFLNYDNNKGEHFVVHIPTGLRVKIFTDKKIFAQKMSCNNKYCAFEKSRTTLIKDVGIYIKAFHLEDIYKVSFGKKDGLKIGTMLEVYQEKKNPFTGKLIGYDEQNFKGG